MMQSADLRNRDDATTACRFDFSRDRRVSVQGQVRPRVQVVIEVRSKDALQMSFVEDDDMIETLAAD